MKLIEREPETTTAYESCLQCEAPLDRGQRYCVECGARSPVPSPATRYIAARRRLDAPLPAASQAARPAGRPRITLPAAILGLAAAVGLVLLGVALAGNGRDDKALIAAIKEQKPPVVNVTGGGAAPAAAATKLPSDFTLSKGYTVKLQTLPIAGTDQASAAKARADAQAKGARAVGILNPDDFTTTPDQGSSNYVLFSGQFKSKRAAEQALAKLKRRFSGAEVIAVKSAAAGGAVIAKTSHGTVHEASKYRATPKQLKRNQQIVKSLAKKKGKDYLKQQKTLPNEIVVPGAGSTPSTGTTGP
jgi:hypothetical protein